MTTRIYALPDDILTQTDFELYQQLLHQQPPPGEEAAALVSDSKLLFQITDNIQ